jgi:hypothetical protein
MLIRLIDKHRTGQRGVGNQSISLTHRIPPLHRLPSPERALPGNPEDSQLLAQLRVITRGRTTYDLEDRVRVYLFDGARKSSHAWAFQND